VGGFTFNLSSSSINPSGTGGTYPFGSVKVDISGTLSGNGYTDVPLTGSMLFADPSIPSPGTETFATQLSFAPLPVPEPGAGLLLGAVLPVLVLVRRKFRG